jgi:hypothetical protein
MDDPTSVHSSSTRQKTYITLQFRIVLEYDGPSLSDTSSIAESFQDSLNIDDEYASSAYTYSSEASSARSGRSGRSAGADLYNNDLNTTRSSNSFPSRRVRDEVIEEEPEHSSAMHHLEALPLEDDIASDDGTIAYPFGTHTRAGRPNLTPATSGNSRGLPVTTDFLTSRGAFQHLSRSSSSSSGSSCTSSEFGARWIEEQKARVAKTAEAKSVRGELKGDGTEGGETMTEYEAGRGRLRLKMDSRGSKPTEGDMIDSASSWLILLGNRVLLRLHLLRHGYTRWTLCRVSVISVF